MRIDEKSAGGVKELVSLGFPLFVSQACETLMMVTDRIFLARLGSKYMSAAMGGGLTCFMLMTFFVGLTGYTNALVAQHYGARQADKCGRVAAQAVFVCFMAYPLLLMVVPAAIKLFVVMGIPEGQLGPQVSYFRIVMFGTIFALLRGTLGSFFSGIGRSKMVMLAAGTSLSINVLVSYVLIFGKLSFPALGIVGAGIGTLVGGASGFLVLLVAYLLPTCRRVYGTLSGLKWHAPSMRKLLRLGSPAGTELFLNLLSFNLLVMLFHARGPSVAAAVTVAFNWDLVSFIPLIGINVGVASLVGRYMGAQRPKLAHKVAMSGLKLVFVYATITVLAYSLLPKLLVGFFLSPNEAEAYDLAVFMVRLVSVYIFADAVQLVFGGALRGAGDTFVPMCMSVAVHWSVFLSAYLSLRVFETSAEIAWVSFVMLIWVSAGLFFFRYRSGRWRTLRVVELKLG